MKKRGPKSKLTYSKALEVKRLTEEGVPLKQACPKAGLSLAGYYRGIERYSKIRDSIKSSLDAQHRATKQEAIETIHDAFKRDWKSAAWWLERNYPREFGRNQLELSGPNGGPIRTESSPDFSKLTPDEIIALNAISERLSGQSASLTDSSGGSEP